MSELIVLVDENDNETGIGEKMKVHEKALLHRAFSIFIRDDAGSMLLQKRAASKYHSGGLWSNACCGHPRPGEPVERAARRRLEEELGFVCELTRSARFTYRAEFDSGLCEYELDHVFTGIHRGGPIRFDSEEAETIRWIHPSILKKELAERPEMFTEWFRIAIARFPALLEVS